MKKLIVSGASPPQVDAESRYNSIGPAECNCAGLTVEAHAESINRVFRQQAGKWTGCAWRTCFGKSELDLNGMNSAQARIMARATSGPEAADWRAAVQWLAQVE